MKQQEYLELISRFETSSLTCLEIEEESFKIHMEKNPAAPAAQTGAVPVRQETAGEKEQPSDSAPDSGFCLIKAPLVGVFYAAPSPEESPFVQTGDRVEKGQVLCLIEAMKMMNELKSPVSGIVRTITGVNGQLAEYGQVLFEVEPC